MRILGFTKHWPKLNNETFTTFRFPWKNGFEFRIGDMVAASKFEQGKKMKYRHKLEEIYV